MQSLRIVPNLRSSVVEEKPAGQVLLFTSELGDSDAALVAGDATVLPFTWSRLVRAAGEPDLELLEVAEPLWVGEWVKAVRYIAVVALVRAVRPGRRRVTTATYAIENLDARARLGSSALDARPVVGPVVRGLRAAALGASLLLLDAIVFGTSGAERNYRRTFGWALRRTACLVLPPRIDACTVCGPGVADGTPREPIVLFLGTPSERKGFDVLVRAWEQLGAADRGWRLVVADPGPAAERALPPGVTVTVDPPRSTIHALLQDAAVVAMPSVGLRRWREQIGLPLVEGLAHGCRVVTTTETGLADDLRGHPLVTLTTPGDPRSLAEGLRRAMDVDRDPAVTTRPPGYTKSDVVAWWLSVGDRRRL